MPHNSSVTSLLNVDIEDLSELSSFCAEANSSFDYDVALDLETRELQQWEYLCHDVEFWWFSIQTIYQEVLSDTLMDVEIMFTDRCSSI